MTSGEHAEFSSRRVLVLCGCLVALGGGIQLLRGALYPALSLTGAGLVAMINFHWLEGVLDRVVQPGRPRLDWWSFLRFLSRAALLAGVLLAILWFPKVDPISIVLGFSALVVALLVEGFRSGLQGGGCT